MPQLIVTANGQVTLRKELLEHLGIRPGDTVNVEQRPGEVVFRAAPKGKISDVFGFFDNPDDIHLTIEEMNEVIANAWAGKR
jgi:bifunctional DNA-binding transcriptional regulator/antitoxin component of YhaV-PrlF toxin-antitoxin module